MLFHHLPHPGRAVKSLKEVIVSLVLQLLLVKVPLRKVRQPSDQGIGGIGIVTTEIIDLEHEICLVLGGDLSSDDLHGFLQRSDMSIETEFPAEVC